MSFELLQTDSDTALFTEWLEQSVLESEVPAVLDHSETVGRVAVLLSLTEASHLAAQPGVARTDRRAAYLEMALLADRSPGASHRGSTCSPGARH